MDKALGCINREFRRSIKNLENIRIDGKTARLNRQLNIYGENNYERLRRQVQMYKDLSIEENLIIHGGKQPMQLEKELRNTNDVGKRESKSQISKIFVYRFRLPGNDLSSEYEEITIRM